MTSEPGAPGASLGRWALVLGFAAAVLGLVAGWRLSAEPVRNTVDVQWTIGLHQALASGLSFGSDVIWTYGPLGFLAFPTPFTGASSALAFAAVVAADLALLLMVYRHGQRLFPVWAAAVMAFIAGVWFTMGMFEALQVAGFAAAIDLLRRDRVPRPMVIAVAAGLLAVVTALGKVNVGSFVALGGAVLVFAVSPMRLRALAAYLGTIVVGTLALWLAMGQSLADLVPYARGSLDMISGYSQAMSVSSPGEWKLMIAFAVIAALVLVSAWLDGRRLPVVRRIAMLGLVVLFTFAFWKHGFVRGHFSQAFFAMLVALLAVFPASVPRPAAAASLAVGVLAFLFATQGPLVRYLPQPSRAEAFAVQVADAALPWRWEDATARTRKRLEGFYDLPPDVLAELQGRTVHVDPYWAAVPTAYPGITWRPEPVMQSYSAYTDYLDEADAGLLRSDSRPERILRWNPSPREVAGRSIPGAVDGRNYWFESPAATLERICRYREIKADGDWEVLGASGTSCGTPQPLGSVSAPAGTSIPVPAAPSPDDVVLVRVHGVDDSLVDKLRATVWKSPRWTATLDGVSYRLVPGTANQGLVLAVPAAAQGTGSFAFGDPVRTISVQRGRATGGRQLTYEFVAVPIGS